MSPLSKHPLVHWQTYRRSAGSWDKAVHTGVALVPRFPTCGGLRWLEVGDILKKFAILYYQVFIVIRCIHTLEYHFKSEIRFLAVLRSSTLPLGHKRPHTILNLWNERGINCFFKKPECQSEGRTRDLRLSKQADLSTTPVPLVKANVKIAGVLNRRFSKGNMPAISEILRFLSHPIGWPYQTQDIDPMTF